MFILPKVNRPYADPGKTGDLIICILADPGSFDDGQIKEFGGVPQGDECTFDTAIYEDIGEPPRSWPSDETLEEKFTALKKRTPKEGLWEAQRLADSGSKPRNLTLLPQTLYYPY